MFDSDPRKALKRKSTSRGKSQALLSNRESVFSSELI